MEISLLIPKSTTAIMLLCTSTPIIKSETGRKPRDLVHDLFSSIWQRHRELQLKTTLATYLYAAIRYKVFELISRKEKASDYLKSISDFAEQQPCLTDHLIREKQLTELIEKEIAALPAKVREVFELSRKENLSHSEIAARLGISEMTVKKQVNNSLSGRLVPAKGYTVVVRVDSRRTVPGSRPDSG